VNRLPLNAIPETCRAAHRDLDLPDVCHFASRNRLTADRALLSHLSRGFKMRNHYVAVGGGKLASTHTGLRFSVRVDYGANMGTPLVGVKGSK
jgi:hypothetical protein